MIACSLPYLAVKLTWKEEDSKKDYMTRQRTKKLLTRTPKVIRS